MAHHRGRFRRTPGCGFGFIMYTCIRMLFILIYMLYKSKSLTLELLLYSWIYIGMNIGLWAQEAVFTHVIDVRTGYVQVMYLGRAPRTKETRPDFRE